MKRKLLQQISSLYLLLLTTISAADSTHPIRPPDVLTELSYTQQAITQIAKHIDVNGSHSQTNIKVINAQPREVYYQAEILYSKSRQLEFEVLNTQTAQHTSPTTDELQPKNVFQLIKKSNVILDKVRVHFNLHQNIQTIKAPTTTTPTQVFAQLIKINSQMSQLLMTSSATNKTYHNITTGIYYLSKLANAKQLDPVPPIETFIASATKNDVYTAEAKAVNKISELFKKQNLTMMQVKLTPNIKPNEETIEAISGIILSEIRYLCIKNNVDITRIKAPYPARQYPTTLLSRLQLLNAMLDRINR